MRSHDSDEDAEGDEQNDEQNRDWCGQSWMVSESAEETRDGSKNWMQQRHSFDPRRIDDVDHTGPLLRVRSNVEALCEILSFLSRHDRDEPLNVSFFKSRIDIFGFEQIETVFRDAVEEEVEREDEEKTDDGRGDAERSCVGASDHDARHEADSGLNEKKSGDRQSGKADDEGGFTPVAILVVGDEIHTEMQHCEATEKNEERQKIPEHDHASVAVAVRATDASGGSDLRLIAESTVVEGRSKSRVERFRKFCRVVDSSNFSTATQSRSVCCS